MPRDETAVVAEREAHIRERLGYPQPPARDVDEASWLLHRRIPEITARYAVGGQAAVYFAGLGQGADPAELHRKVWNDSGAPLLIVVQPHQVLVYDAWGLPGRRGPARQHVAPLLQTVSSAMEAQNAEALAWLSWQRVASGDSWNDPHLAGQNHRQRVDHTLLEHIDGVREELTTAFSSADRGIGDEEARELTYALLGRAMFVRYLEDRRLLTPEDMRKASDHSGTFKDILEDRSATIRLFEGLNRRFNGDLFPVTDRERACIKDSDLDCLRGLFDLHPTGQLLLWPLNFAFLPVETISAVYGALLDAPSRRQAGAYYTPLSLVDMVLEETLPIRETTATATFLDPACGSGSFLVRALQRLAFAVYRDEGPDALSMNRLWRLLLGNLRGVDLHPAAVRVAAFNLYLAVLELLPPRERTPDAWRSFRFEPLLNRVLYQRDAFEATLQAELEASGLARFDRVVGNPPWGENTITPAGRQYLRSASLPPSPDDQAAPAFLHRAAGFVAGGGEVAMLAPARSMLQAVSGPAVESRHRLMETLTYRAVVNLAALYPVLFPDAQSPAAAIFLSSAAPPRGHRFAYATPSVSPYSSALGIAMLDFGDVDLIDQQEAAGCSMLWGALRFGATRDLALLKRIRDLWPTDLGGFADSRGWSPPREGFYYNGKTASANSRPAPWLTGLPLIETDALPQLTLDTSGLAKCSYHMAQRPRTRDLFSGPLVLVRETPRGGRIHAAYCRGPIAFRHQVIGIPGTDEQDLMWIAGYLSSALAAYSLFLTSSLLTVERASAIKADYMALPVPDPRMYPDAARRVSELVTSTARSGHSLTPLGSVDAVVAKLDEEFASVAGLTDSERELVDDTLAVRIPLFYAGRRQRPYQSRSRPRALEPPSPTELGDYAEAFRRTAESCLAYTGEALNALAYEAHGPLRIVRFDLVKVSKRQAQACVREHDSAVDSLLANLEEATRLQYNDVLYARRLTKIYQSRSLYLVKPAELRYWTRSAAREDADAAIAEWVLAKPVQESAR